MPRNDLNGEDLRIVVLMLPKSKRLYMANEMQKRYPDLSASEIEDFFNVSIKGGDIND